MNVWILCLLSIVLSCDWKQSEQIRKYLKNRVDPFLAQHKLKAANLPAHCPLKNTINRDVLAKVQDLRPQSGPWQCQVCSKTFNSAEFLEVHINNFHLDYAPNEICLADLCLFLPCEGNTHLLHRCEMALQECFNEDVLLDARQLCVVKEVEDLTLSKALNLVLIIIVAIAALIYYMIIWAEHEEQPVATEHRTKKD